MVGSCWRNSACLCVLWSYNKQWSNGIIISYISFIHTSPRHTDLRQLQGRRDKKRHEPSIIIYHGLSTNVIMCQKRSQRDIYHSTTSSSHHHESSPTMFNSHASPPVIRSHLLSSTMMTKTIKACSENNRFHQVSFSSKYNVLYISYPLMVELPPLHFSIRPAESGRAPPP